MLKCPICGYDLVHIQKKSVCLCCGHDDEEKMIPTQKISPFVAEKNSRIAQQAQKNLLNDLDGSYKYCLCRGITPNAIRDWGLGYISAESRDVSKLWHQRLLFPIRSNDGTEIVAFGGRLIRADDRPKYVNSINEFGYDKSSSLYGYSAIPQKASVIYLCEGYLDAIAMDTHGFAYPVASLGTALTRKQALLIREKAESVVIAYDADEAGENATLRAIEILWDAGLTDISRLKPQEAKDVDEALNKGSMLIETGLLEYLANAGQERLLFDAYLKKGGRRK